MRKKIDEERAYNCSRKCKHESDAVKAKLVDTCMARYNCPNGGGSMKSVEKAKIRRTDKSFQYTRVNGYKSTYLPDFVVTDEFRTYVEVKSLYTAGLHVKNGKVKVRRRELFINMIRKLRSVEDSGMRMVLAIGIKKAIIYYQGEFSSRGILNYLNTNQRVFTG